MAFCFNFRLSRSGRHWQRERRDLGLLEEAWCQGHPWPVDHVRRRQAAWTDQLRRGRRHRRRKRLGQRHQPTQVRRISRHLRNGWTGELEKIHFQTSTSKTRIYNSPAAARSTKCYLRENHFHTRSMMIYLLKQSILDLEVIFFREFFLDHPQGLIIPIIPVPKLSAHTCTRTQYLPNLKVPFGQVCLYLSSVFFLVVFMQYRLVTCQNFKLSNDFV